MRVGCGHRPRPRGCAPPAAESTTDEPVPEFVSLEEADENVDDADEEVPDIPDVEIEVEGDEEGDENAFLEDDDEDPDISDVIRPVEGEGKDEG